MAVSDLELKPFPPVNNASKPQRMTEGAVGFDFYAEEIVEETDMAIWYRTGYGVNIPDDCFGDLRARSSVSETGLFLANGAGVVDPDYQGEVQFRFYKAKHDARVFDPAYKKKADREDDTQRYWSRQVDIYEPGDRIGQLLVLPVATRIFAGTKVVEDFDEDTERGEGGFGSTDDN